MKKKAYSFIAILLAIVLAVLSSCKRDGNAEASVGESSAMIGDSSFESSIHEESSEESAEPESSAEESEPEESSEESEPEESVYIPPEGTPTKLVPVVEFGFGKGDYKLGYHKDYYGFVHGPRGMYISGNEILIHDDINDRFVVYRDGKLIDKVDISVYHNVYNFTFLVSDEYYYAIDRVGRAAFRIDRQTKEFEEIIFKTNDLSEEEYYRWSYYFFTVGDSLYIHGYHPEKEDVCYLINGTATSPAELPPTENEFSIRTLAGDFVLADSNGPISKLDIAEEKDKIDIDTYLLGGAKYIHQEIGFRRGDYEFYNIFYKLSKSGKIIGRYVQLRNSNTYKPMWSLNYSGHDFEYKLTDEGDLLVVYGDETHVGIYKVEFGMDELPEELR